MSNLEHAYPGDSLVASFLVVAAAVVVVSTAAVLLSCGLKSRPVPRHLVLGGGLFAVLAAPIIAAVSAALGVTWFALPFFSTTNEATTIALMPAPQAVEGALEPAPSRNPVAPVSQPAALPQVPVSRTTGMETKRAIVAGVPVSEARPHQSAIRAFATGVLLVWLLGTVAALTRFASSCVRLLRLRSALRAAGDERLSRVFEEASALLETARCVTIGISSRVRTPAVLGWFRPAVVLPECSLTQLTDSQLRDVLVHEMAHVLRRDQLVLPLQVLAQALFWPIATVHFLCRQLDCAREDVCDNFVLAARPAANYGETLLRLAELACGATTLPATTGILHWHGKLENRIAGLLSQRRDRAQKTGRLTTTLVLGLFVLAGGLLSGTRIVAQQRPAPGKPQAPETATQPSNPTFRQADEAARPGNQFIFATQLAGAKTEPVFLDAETGRYLTPPRDLVPKENLGQPLAKWVFTDPLKGWIRQQGIDFAAQTDNWSYITVVGFDMRGGGVLPKGVRELAPAEIVKKVGPLPSESIEWNLTKTYAEFIPFVTREGSVGLFYAGIEPRFRRDNIDFRYQLARDPQVPQLTGQPVLPVFEPAILAVFEGALDADVIDHRLRLKLPGTSREIEVGGGQVVVRGPTGVEIRASRLGTSRLRLDGASGTANCTGRGVEAVLRPVAGHVQIETNHRIAEADRLSIRFPALTLENERALSGKPVPAARPDPAEKATRLLARRRSQEKAAEYLAEMAEKGYALRPGESARCVAPAFLEVRKDFWRARHPGEYYPMFEHFPESAFFDWDGQKLHDRSTFVGDSRLGDLLNGTLGFQRQYVSGPAGLLQMTFVGDWIVRTGAPDEAIARDFEKILRAQFNHPIHLEFRNVNRDVYVVRGRYHLTPLPGQPAGGVQVFGKTVYPNVGYAGGGSGSFRSFLQLLITWIDTPIVDEVASPPQLVRWKNNEDMTGPGERTSREKTREAHDPALVLPNITRQTGLQFSKETRPVRTLFVEPGA
jgi:beta-lactamase regulating signal transducer with metallopeptidase domain